MSTSTLQIAIETVVTIIKDEIRIANEEQKIALRRALYEVRYVQLRTFYSVDGK